ncbi:hypothetical protein SETIT_1G177200v2 [Setaria italica]|uniref:ATP-dependent DNA helicase n=1 Tax=Setaria italica TaxID=4555 RepID=K3YY53_SETIT|nr:hypothetical protein SETIT_1G177200v2 [Setaria italica]
MIHFSPEYIQHLKDSYPGRSYYGIATNRCKCCGAIFCRSKHFLEKIRQYNSLFSFTSTGGNIDKSINQGDGPYAFRVSGQIHHRIGSLLPQPNNIPKFVELYIFDTQNEINNRLQAITHEDSNNTDLDIGIIKELKEMLDTYDPVQYEMPTANELALLIVGDYSTENCKRDIIVSSKRHGLQQISIYHPAYMALQYPLLFPYGERGYQINIYYNNSKGKRKRLTMHDYFKYQLHYRSNQPNPYLCNGRLSKQIKSGEICKRVLLPCSHIGSSRYMIQNYHDDLEMLLEGQQPNDQPDIIVRVFHMKLQELLHDIESGIVFGPIDAILYSIEFQKRGKCSKKFPKEFQEETKFDDNGFTIYRRRDTRIYVYRENHNIDNKWVVPHNMFLLKKIIKYLCKYVHKGPDKAKIIFQGIKKGEDTPRNIENDTIDEIKEYLECRYMCEQDALWRLFGFEIHHHTPPVERLPVHLPLMNNVTIKSDDELKTLMKNPNIQKTMLTEWFTTNQQYEKTHELTYCKFLTKWTWDQKNRKWNERKHGFKIGHLYYVNPAEGERLYLRMLPTVVKGAKNYKDIKTYNEVVYSTFKDACFARGLLNNDDEWYQTFKEAATWSSSFQLRQLFVTRYYFAIYKTVDNFEHELEHKYHPIKHHITDNQVRDMLLDDLQYILFRNGVQITTFDLPNRSIEYNSRYNNHLIEEETSYDIDQLEEEANILYRQLNTKQKVAFNTIVESVLQNKPGFYFASGYGGTGKTFLWNTIVSYLRARKKIVLAVASSRVASLLLPNGRTAHSKFKIPLDIDETSI